MSDRFEKAKAVYEALVATQNIERKGKSMPYTSMNGNMYSFVTKEGQLGLRLGREQREAFLKTYRAKLVITYNTVMKEYVEVPAGLLKKPKELAKHFAASVAYAKTLKAKPTTRPKPTKKATKKKATKKKATKEKATKKKAAKKQTTRPVATRRKKA